MADQKITYNDYYDTVDKEEKVAKRKQWYKQEFNQRENINTPSSYAVKPKAVEDDDDASEDDYSKYFVDKGAEEYFDKQDPTKEHLFKYNIGTNAAQNWQSMKSDGFCDTSSKDATLRKILMDQLYEMSQAAASKDGEAKTGCTFACGEDAELEKMQKLYSTFNETLSGISGSGAGARGLCGIGDFSNNPRIQVLESQRKVLEYVSFGFLHQTCEGTNNCNPFAVDGEQMPMKLLKCCGLYEGAPLFYDGDLQAVGSYLAGAQGSPKGLTPAANGHCANFYPSGTIAPGRDKQLYVNVCYIATAGERGTVSVTVAQAGGAAKLVGMKWVKANRLERAKFEALRELDAKIVAQKRMVLQMNHKMLQLQQSLVGLNPGGFGGAAVGDRDAFLTKRLQAVVASARGRVQNEMGRRFGAMEDRQQSLLPQMAMSPSARMGSELRAIESLKRRGGQRGKSRSRSSRNSSGSRR